MSKKVMLRIFSGVVIFLIAALLIQFTYRMSCKIEKKTHHEQIMEFINNDVTYEPDKLDINILAITEWIKTSNVREEDLGHLYERLSNCYKAKNDIVHAYDAIGKSLYYLEEGRDYNYTINIYLDLASQYIMNLSYVYAQKCMDHVYELQELDEITDLQIRSYAYRIQGILQRENGSYEDALKSFERANEIVEESGTNTYESAYHAINDVNIAKTYVKMGLFEEAEHILMEYSDSDFLNPTIFVEMMVRGVIIPFYETSAYLYAYKADDAMIVKSVDKLDEECGKYEYYEAELNVLQELADRRPPEDSPEFTQGYYKILNRVYRLAAESQQEKYSSIVAGSIDSAHNAEKVSDLEKKARWSRMQTYGMYIIFIVVLIIVICTIINTSKRDALTGVYNRRELNRVIGKLKSKNLDYAVCMIDIDDFKHVNDTFGHQNGDVVLSSLGRMMLNTVSQNGRVYRFGGEEFTIVITKNLANRKTIAEAVRQNFENLKWDFTDTVLTLSIGVAAGNGTEDIIKNADDNLYKSKRNGKNCVTAG